MKLFQYGCSVSLGEEATICYGQLIAKQLGAEFIQHSESSASNPHIALKFCETYKQITPNDLVIFGWSHPNRNSWFNKYENKWEHLNYIQQKKPGSINTASVKDYVLNQNGEYIQNLHTWYPKHIVDTTCKLNNLHFIHVDCVPGMVDILMKNKSKYIADHLHPNNEGHHYIHKLLQEELSYFNSDIA